jgi:DNA-binding LacI/PurR family transcriptional regulator
VSRASASLVIRDAPGPSAETRERVLQAAAELGYRPDPAAQRLRRHRSRLLGVLINPREAFHADLIDAIYPAAERLGYEIVLGAQLPTRDEHTAVEGLVDSRCEALILLGPTAGARQLSALAERLPLVAVGRRVRGAGIDTVATADADGVRQAVDHLVGLGHRAIVHVDGGRGAGSAERRNGYRTAMRRQGLDHAVRIIPGDHTAQAGGEAARTILQQGDLPTAVFASNDSCAIGVLDALVRAGVDVPGDVSIVGFDDSQLSRLTHINLTTVRQDAEQMADLAVRAAVERVEGSRTTSRDIALNPHLVVRGSSGRARCPRAA